MGGRLTWRCTAIDGYAPSSGETHMRRKLSHTVPDLIPVAEAFGLVVRAENFFALSCPGRWRVQSPCVPFFGLPISTPSYTRVIVCCLNWAAKARCDWSVLAMTITPEVSLSRRWTKPGRSFPPTREGVTPAVAK